MAHCTLVVSQLLGAQSWSCLGPHEPLPWHVPPSVAMPLTQLALRQDVFAPAYEQEVALAPSQRPPQFVPSVAHGCREPFGAPPTTVEQTPSVPGRLHAWHCPLHADRQHSPSTQKLDAHSLLLLQLAPGSFKGTHFPPEQY